MANKDTVTNKDLYTAILGIHEKIDHVVENRIHPLEVWRAEIMGKLAVVGAVFVVAANVAIDWIKSKFLKNL